MSSNEEGEDLYIIPHNYIDNGKFLGLIEMQSIYTAGIICVPLTAINFWLLPVPLSVSIITFIVFIAPITLVSLVGIGQDTLVNFLRFIYKFYRNAKVYKYEKW